MANVQRWRHNNDEVVTPAIQSGVVIEIGDLVYQSSQGDVYPASSQPDQGSLVANQRLFACRFLGVAQQQSRSGDTDPIRVKTKGVFEFIIAAVAVNSDHRHDLGQRIGAIENAAGTALLDQTVHGVQDDALTIGRQAATAIVGATSVLVSIESEIMAGGTDAGTCESSSSEGI